MVKYTNKQFVTKVGGKKSKFKSGMVREIHGLRPRYDLIYIPLLTRWAALMARGVEKYGERNWEKADSEDELNRFYAAAFRHFVQWIENADDGEDHAAAVIFNIGGAELVKEKLKGKK